MKIWATSQSRSVTPVGRFDACAARLSLLLILKGRAIRGSGAAASPLGGLGAVEPLAGRSCSACVMEASSVKHARSATLNRTFFSKYTIVPDKLAVGRRSSTDA